eukprot:Tbor_TRINITY_DN5441_c0_g1::TRINITY_DN5441_c0_g1_i1::g.25450::m.25450/K16810/TBCCD1; TBCC domain-containing protein 1
MPPRWSNDSSSREGLSSSLLFTVNPLFFESAGCLVDARELSLQLIDNLNSIRVTKGYITYNDWRTFAIENTEMKEYTKYQSLFDIFHTLSSKPEAKIESSRLLLGKMNGVVEESRYKTAAASRTISLPGFSLFLMAQAHLERQGGSVNPVELVNYAKQQIDLIVSSVAVTKPQEVTIKDIQELGLFFREFVNGVEQPFGTSLDSLWQPNERTIPVSLLSRFLSTKIVYPGDIPRMYGNVVLSQADTAMQIVTSPLGPSPTKFPGYSFKIQSASKTNFYVTSLLPSTRLQGLSNCTVQLGPVSGVLYVSDCENCVVSAICGALVINKCKNVTLFVCTNTPPVGLERQGPNESTMVKVAPYNTHYATLEEHISSSGLNPKLNLWRIGVPESCIFPASKFISSSFPVTPHSASKIVTRTNPCPLPKEYQEALTQRINAFNTTSQMMHNAYKQLEAAGRKDLADNLRQKTQKMFIDWCHEKGQTKGLLDLLHNNTSPGV